MAGPVGPPLPGLIAVSEKSAPRDLRLWSEIRPAPPSSPRLPRAGGCHPLLRRRLLPQLPHNLAGTWLGLAYYRRKTTRLDRRSIFEEPSEVAVEVLNLSWVARDTSGNP